MWGGRGSGSTLTMKRAIRSPFVGTLATDGALLAIGVLTGALTARLLLPEGRGALAAVLFWPQLLAGVGLCSLNEAATYRIGAQADRVRLITASSLWVAIALAGATILVGYLVLPLLLGAERGHLLSLARGYLLAFVPFNFVALTLLAVDHGGLSFGRYNLLRLLVPLVYLTCLMVLWITDRVSVGSVVAANCAGTVLTAIVRFKLQGPGLLLRPSRQEAKALASLTAHFHPASVLLLLAAQADQFVVLSLWHDAALGEYVVALTIATSGLGVVSSAFHRVLFPRLASQRDPMARAELLARAIRHATMLLVALSAPVALVMPWAIRWLFGPSFAEALYPGWVLLAAHVLGALKSILIQGFRGMGDGRPGMVAAFISLAVTLSLAWPMAALWHLVGVAVAVGIANLAALAYLVHQVKRCTGLQPARLWGLTPGTLSEIRSALFGMRPGFPGAL